MIGWRGRKSMAIAGRRLEALPKRRSASRKHRSKPLAHHSQRVVEAPVCAKGLIDKVRIECVCEDHAILRIKFVAARDDGSCNGKCQAAGIRRSVESTRDTRGRRLAPQGHRRVGML